MFLVIQLFSNDSDKYIRKVKSGKGLRRKVVHFVNKSQVINNFQPNSAQLKRILLDTAMLSVYFENGKKGCFWQKSRHFDWLESA